MKKVTLFLLIILRFSFCVENPKNSNSNIIKNVGVWLNDTVSNYNFYVDPTVPAEFRNVIQAVCDDLEPLTVVGEKFTLSYTGLESAHSFDDNICQIKYSDYGFEFIAKCCNAYSPTDSSANELSQGSDVKFDVLINNNYTYTTGNFGTSGAYDRASVLRHEFGHGVAGLAHNNYSPLMKSETAYND